MADDVPTAMRGQTELVFADANSFLSEAGTDKLRLLLVAIFITEFDQKLEIDSPQGQLALKSFAGATLRVSRLPRTPSSAGS